jgi:RNA polymerase sigma-70 factor (ECF subfamily)
VTKLEDFQALRPMLFSIAYRILGSVTEAEDAVQETWLRYDGSETEPRSPKAFLAATVTRLSIDVLRSSRVKREDYVGEWFPEPLVEDPYDDPARAVELADSVSMASLLLLERLSPLERAAFVLRDVFAFDYAAVAAAVGRSPAACRQLVVRAREHMATGRTRYVADRRQRDRLAGAFFDALRDGDVDRLRDLLAADVQLVGDAGGKAPVWVRAIVGADKVARMLDAMYAPLDAIGATVDERELNGQPGAIFRDRDANIINTWTIDVVDGQIQTIRTVLNPDKLRHLGPVADAFAVVSEANRVRQLTRRAWRR